MQVASSRITVSYLCCRQGKRQGQGVAGWKKANTFVNVGERCKRIIGPANGMDGSDKTRLK